jgi:hypothetical protein
MLLNIFPLSKQKYTQFMNKACNAALTTTGTGSATAFQNYAQAGQNAVAQDAQLAELNNSLAAKYSELKNADTTSTSNVNAQIVGLQTQITSLQLQEAVVDYIMPCGQHSGYNEVILRMKSGKNVCFFENGNNRFLSILLPGNYMLSDGSNCTFSVNNQNLICRAGICR